MSWLEGRRHTSESLSPVLMYGTVKACYYSCKFMHILTDILVYFLKGWVLHIHFKPKCSTGWGCITTANRCSDRVQTNCRDIRLTHCQLRHWCWETEWWHLFGCTWRKIKTTVYYILTIRKIKNQQYLEMKRTHQLLVKVNDINLLGKIINIIKTTATHKLYQMIVCKE